MAAVLRQLHQPEESSCEGTISRWTEVARRVVSRFYGHAGKHPNNTIFSFNYHNVRHHRYRARPGPRFPAPACCWWILAPEKPLLPDFADITARYVALDVPESLAAGSNVHVERVGAGRACRWLVRWPTW